MAKFMLGSFRHTLDEKNRVRIPSKFREGLGGSLLAIPGRSGCLYIGTEENIGELASRFVLADGYSNFEELDAGTALFANGDVLEEDAQGRVLFTKNLKSTIGANKDIVFVGKGKYVEVWAAETYDLKFGVLNPDKISKMLEDLKKYGA